MKPIYLFEAKDILDLCRASSNFDYTSKGLFFYSNRLIFLKDLGDFYIGIYKRVENEVEDFIKYEISDDGKEYYRFVSSIEENASYIDIIKLGYLNISKKKLDIEKVLIENNNAMLYRLINKGIEGEEIKEVYLFDKDNKSFLCSFDLFNEPICAYQITKDFKDALFIKYDYLVKKFVGTNANMDHTGLYLKIIRLKDSLL